MGAHGIKIMAGGGCMSPTDEIEHTQSPSTTTVERATGSAPVQSSSVQFTKAVALIGLDHSSNRRPASRRPFR